jgi:hypothetical protein
MKTRKIKLMGTCSTHGEMRNTYEVSVKRPEGKRSRGRHGSGCEDIKMKHAEIEL